MKWLILFLTLTGCTYETINNDTDEDAGDDMAPRVLVGSQQTIVHTTANLYPGSIVGGSPQTDPSKVQYLNNLQRANLEPGEYTLQFSVIPPADGLGIFTWAIINWKVDGQQIRRIMSVVNGATISGVSEGVDVQIADFSGPVVNSGARRTTVDYQVLGTLSKGTRPTIMIPPVLDSSYTITLVGETTSQLIPIPQDAGVISMMALVTPLDAVTIAPDDITIHQIGVFGGINNSVLDYSPRAQQVGPDWVPINPAATSISITNNHAGPLNRINTKILFGIEG